jgi:Mor family transcriptional regulator
MGYIKAEDILPQELIAQIQQYVDGQSIYIPRRADRRRAWGCATAYKAELDARNSSIRSGFRQGTSVDDLADQYHLSEKSIRRILRKK